MKIKKRIEKNKKMRWDKWKKNKHMAVKATSDMEESQWRKYMLAF
ncbi:hypothetical protein ABEX05_00350 [Bacillus velezensis]